MFVLLHYYLCLSAFLLLSFCKATVYAALDLVHACEARYFIGHLANFSVAAATHLNEFTL